MRDLVRPKPPTPKRNTSVVVAVVAATMMGATFGLLIADREAFLVLKRNISRHLAGPKPPVGRPSDVKPQNALQGLKAARSQEEPGSKIVPIGLSPIGALRYSPQSGSVHLVFDLEAASLVGTGKLDSPDRIYFDLQEISRGQGHAGQLRAPKAVSINDDPVTGVRIAQRESGAMRIVLDLSRSCDFTYQISTGPPSRLTVELRPHATGTSSK